MDHHIDLNNIHSNIQSAYRACLSTETALRRVHYAIVAALDVDSSVSLIMLDLSAALDVIGHLILMERLEFAFRISDSAFDRIDSYLSEIWRTQKVIL